MLFSNHESIFHVGFLYLRVSLCSVNAAPLVLLPRKIKPQVASSCSGGNNGCYSAARVNTEPSFHLECLKSTEDAKIPKQNTVAVLSELDRSCLRRFEGALFDSHGSNVNASLLWRGGSTSLTTFAL